METGREVRQRRYLSPVPFKLLSKYPTNDARGGLGAFKLGGQIIRILIQAGDTVLLAREETAPQGKIDGLV